MIEVYKTMHGFNDPLTTGSLFQIVPDDFPTRNFNSLKITKPRTNYDFFKFYFTNRVINRWNCLPEDVVTARTIDSFKSKLDKFYCDLHYCCNIDCDM